MSQEVMTCPVTLGKHMVSLLLRQTYHVLFTILFSFFGGGGVGEHGGDNLFTRSHLRIFKLERKRVFVINLVRVQSLYKLLPVHTFMFIGCEKISMSYITLIIAAEKDHGPKTEK